MAHSSPRKAQVEPLAVLAAVFAVTTALGLYAGVLTDITAPSPDHDGSQTTLTRLLHTVSTGTALVPSAVTAETIATASPGGVSVNVTIRSSDTVWTVGPAPPPDTSGASQLVPVKIGETICPGRIRVVVWT